MRQSPPLLLGLPSGGGGVPLSSSSFGQQPSQHGYRKPKKPKKSGGFNPGKHVLLIHVLEGRMLANRDVGGFSDPYVEAALSFTGKKETRRTKEKARTANCIWDEYLQFEFDCIDEMHMDAGKLDLCCKDADVLVDDAIGSVHLDLREIYAKRYHQIWQEWIALSDYPPDFKLEGFLRVSITVLGPSEVYVIPSAVRRRHEHAGHMASLFASERAEREAVALSSRPAHASPPQLGPPSTPSQPSVLALPPPPPSARGKPPPRPGAPYPPPLGPQYPPGTSPPQPLPTPPPTPPTAPAAAPAAPPAPGALGAGAGGQPPGVRSRSIRFPAVGGVLSSSAPMAPPEEEPAEDFFWPRPRPPPLAHVDAFVIHIDAIKAEHLPRMDLFSRRGSAAVDAFVEVDIGGYKSLSTEIITSYDPKWYSRVSIPLILPRKVDDVGRPVPIPRSGDVDFDTVYYPFFDRIRMTLSDSDVIGSDLIATLPYTRDLSVRSLLLRLWGAERRIAELPGMSAGDMRKLVEWRPEDEKIGRVEEEAEQKAAKEGRRGAFMGPAPQDLIWARNEVEPVPRWINLYGAPPDTSGEYCDNMNNGVQRGSAYRGRLLMRAWMQRTSTLDIVPKFLPTSVPLEFGDAEVRLSFDVFDSAYLRVPDSSVVGTSVTCRIEINMGPYTIRSFQSMPIKHGSTGWDAHVTTTLRFTEIVPPAPPHRDGSPTSEKDEAARKARAVASWAVNLPDVFVSVYRGTSKSRLGYIRVKAADLLARPPAAASRDEVRGGLDWAPVTELNWHPLSADGVATSKETSAEDGDFAGFLFCRACLQVVGTTAPGESRPFGTPANAVRSRSASHVELYVHKGAEEAWVPPPPTSVAPFSWAPSDDPAVAAEEERLPIVARRILREAVAPRMERVESLIYMASKLLPGDQPGTSDGYVRMRLWTADDKFSVKTSVIYKSQNPVWNERFVADLKVREFGWTVAEDPSGIVPSVAPISGRTTIWPIIYIEVWDRDETTRDDLLGIYHLPIDAFPENMEDLLRGEDYKKNAPKGSKRTPFLPLSFKLCKHVPGRALVASKGTLVGAFLRHVPGPRGERPCVELAERPRRARIRLDILGIRLIPTSAFVRGDRLLLEFDVGDNRSFAMEWPEPGSAEAEAAAAAMRLVADPFAAVRQAAESAASAAKDVAGAMSGAQDKKEPAGVDASGVKGGNAIDKVVKGAGDAFLRFLDSATVRRTVYVPYEFYERALAGYRPVLTVRVFKYVSRLPIKVMAGVAIVKISDRVLQCSRSGEYWRPLPTRDLDGRPSPGSAAWPPLELRKPPRGFSTPRGGPSLPGGAGVPLGVSASFVAQNPTHQQGAPATPRDDYCGRRTLGRRPLSELAVGAPAGGGGVPRAAPPEDSPFKPVAAEADSDAGSVGSWQSNAEEDAEDNWQHALPGARPGYPGAAFVPRELKWTGHHADERFRRELKDLQMWNESPIIRGAKVASTASFSDKINEFFGNRVQLDSTESIGKLKVWATLEEEDNQAPDTPPWQMFERLSTEVLPVQITPQSRFSFFPKQRVVVRCYVLRGYNLPQMDVGEQGKADPYLRFLLGGLEDIRKKERKAATMQPKFYDTFTKHIELPGSSLLTVQLFDYDVLGHDELIGETTIDLEDRWYSRQWQASIAAWDPLKRRTYSLPSRPDPETLAPGVFLTRPMERRTLRDPREPKLSRGQVEMIVDMMTLEEAASHPAITLVPPHQKFEIRCIIWQARKLAIKDRVKNSNDLFVACVLEAGDAFEELVQETDVHFNARDGTGLLHYRFVFPVELPLAHPVLKLQAFDKDVVGNDAIGEVALDVADLCDSAYQSNSGVTRRRLRTTKIARTWLRIYHPDVPEELKRREAERGGLLDCLKAPARALTRAAMEAVGVARDFYEDYCTGELEVEVEVMPAELAVKRPAAKGRGEPNRNPFIPEPARSRYSWFNPLDVVKDWMGPELYGKAAGIGVCLLICLCLAFLIPLIISNTISFKLAMITR